MSQTASSLSAEAGQHVYQIGKDIFIEIQDLDPIRHEALELKKQWDKLSIEAKESEEGLAIIAELNRVCSDEAGTTTVKSFRQVYGHASWLFGRLMGDPEIAH